MRRKADRPTLGILSAQRIEAEQEMLRERERALKRSADGLLEERAKHGLNRMVDSRQTTMTEELKRQAQERIDERRKAIEREVAEMMKAQREQAKAESDLRMRERAESEERRRREWEAGAEAREREAERRRIEHDRMEAERVERIKREREEAAELRRKRAELWDGEMLPRVRSLWEERRNSRCKRFDEEACHICPINCEREEPS